jgi:hypothetical protein
MNNAPDNVLERIKKLLQLATRNTSEAEASSAAAKAQALCEEYNLDVERLANSEQKDGRREKLAVDGGFYKYQTELWDEVAHLNFCIHWISRAWHDKHRTVRRHHTLVGRKVNTATTVAMATYLQQVIDRLTKEKTGEGNQAWDKWAMSYRRGMAHRIIQNELNQRASGAAEGTALILATYIDEETDANLDFLNGEGYSARKRAERLAYRAVNAAIAKRKEENYARWAAANPEKARETEARKQKEEERRIAKLGRRRYDYSLDPSAYWAGHRAGDDVSIDLQTEHRKPAGLIRGS